MNLSHNRISDVSVFARMERVGHLGLMDNLISDISALADADLDSSAVTLRENLISDVSPLAGKRFDWLDLKGNQISDISALRTIGVHSFLDLRGNPLNLEAYETYIPMIQANNPDADVRYDPIHFGGDLNGDGFVGQSDLGIVLDWWGKNVAPGVQPDPSGDGFVGQADLDIVLQDWGHGTLSASPVPEPGTIALLALGGAAVIRRRRG